MFQFYNFIQVSARPTIQQTSRINVNSSLDWSTPSLDFQALVKIQLNKPPQIHWSHQGWMRAWSVSSQLGLRSPICIQVSKLLWVARKRCLGRCRIVTPLCTLVFIRIKVKRNTSPVPSESVAIWVPEPSHPGKECHIRCLSPGMTSAVYVGVHSRELTSGNKTCSSSETGLS